MRFLDEWCAVTCGHANKTGTPRKATECEHTPGLTILGTDTDVGKTYVATLLIRHLVAQGWCVGAYKPVASGIRPGEQGQETDADKLREACQNPWPIERVCPQYFKAALAPPVAAARENSCVDDALLRSGAQWWHEFCDVLVVESAGGAMSPLSSQSTVLDVATDLGYPVVLVAGHRLGMMSQVLLTLEAVRNRGLDVLALVVNELLPQATSSGQNSKYEIQNDEDRVRIDESLACLLPFCGKIDCYRLDYAGSTLFPV